MNKTAIISFMLPYMLAELWKVSRNMRKRLKWMLKDKVLILSKYSKKGLIINGGFCIADRWSFTVKTAEKMNRGVLNREVKTQADIDSLFVINGTSFSCELNLTEPIKPVTFDFLYSLQVDQNNFQYYSQVVFKKVMHLTLAVLSETQFKSILSKFESIRNLTISIPFIPKTDLSSFGIRNLTIKCTSVKGLINLPSCLEMLDIRQFSDNSFKNLVCRRIKHVLLPNNIAYTRLIGEPGIGYILKPDIKWLKTVQGLNKIHFTGFMTDFLDFLPSSLRHVTSYCNGLNTKNYNTAEIKRKLPYLISLTSDLVAEVYSELSLRVFDKRQTMGAHCGQIDARPRKIVLTDRNSERCLQYREIFEKATHIIVQTKGSACLSYLSDNIKFIHFYNVKLDEKRLILSSLG